VLGLSDEAQEWRWVGEDGVQTTVPESDLITRLSSEELPNYTLVWRKGWLEWLPAMQVEELAWALPPGKADEPVKARTKEGAAVPPAPPLYRYPVIKRRAGNLRSDRPGARGPAAPRPGGRVGPLPEPKTLPFDRDGDKTIPFIQAFPEVSVLDEEEEVEMASIESSSPTASEGDDTEEAELIDTDSAPDASIGKRQYGDEDEAETRVVPSRPPPPGPTYVAPHRPPPASEKPPDGYDAEVLPRIPPPPPPPTDLAAYANAFRTERGAPKWRSPYVLGGFATAVIVGGIALATRSGDDEPEVSSATASAEPAGSAAPSTRASGAVTATPLENLETAEAPKEAPRLRGTPCVPLTAAIRVADWAEPAVMPSFAAIPGSARIAVGFAQSEQYAI